MKEFTAWLKLPGFTVPVGPNREPFHFEFAAGKIIFKTATSWAGKHPEIIVTFRDALTEEGIEHEFKEDRIIIHCKGAKK